MSRPLPYAPAFPLRRTAALLVILLAAFAVSLSGGSPANAADGPSVSSVTVASDAGDDDTYVLGETITITVTFSEAVDVTGTPQIKIDMDPADWGTKVVDYTSGSGTSSLTFDHEVVQPNYSSQGIAVLANSLALNGGTIRSASSQADVDLSHTGLGHNAAHRVDWQQAPSAPTTTTPAPAPTVTFVAVSSVPGVDGSYALGETIRVTLSFSEAVNVAGTPRLAIDMDPADWGRKWAAYESGSGTSNISFAHTVVEPNFSSQGIAVLADSLELNGGTIRSASSQTDAALSHPGKEHDPQHKVNWQLSPPQPNQAPVLNTGLQNHGWFVNEQNAPRGVLVSKSFAGLFSDPDGDQLMYSAAITGGRAQLLDDVAIGSWGRSDLVAAQSPLPREATQRVFIEVDADDDWDALEPPLAQRPVITVTVTATDPTGLSASISGDFLIIWEPAGCELAPPERVSAQGVVRAAVASWQAPSGDDACEPIGYRVGARNLDGGAWVSETAAPEARSHLLDGLTSGLIEYYVTAIYPEGPSKRPRALPQSVVPEACDLTLAVEANVDRGISGTWTNMANMPAGCAFGLEIEYEYKQSTWDHFRNYGRFRNHQAVNPNQPSFIAYGLKPGVTYDFRIVAVDAAGRKNESNVASATVVYDADATPDANSPLNLRVHPDNNSGAVVTWDAPASVATGRTLSGYVVEWRSGTTSTATVAADATSHRITGLTDGTTYTVRVAARTTGSSPATHDAWTVPSPPFTAWSEPTQVWFAPNSPRILGSIAGIETATNKVTSVVCNLQLDGFPPISPPTNCPAGTQVTVTPTGGIPVRLWVTATAVLGSESTSISTSGKPGGPAGIASVASAGAESSDGNPATHEGKIVIAWEAASTTGVTGTIRYYVGYRADTDPRFGNWVAKTATERSHTYTGIADGTYEVTVLATAVTVGDHDNNPLTPIQEIETDGFNSPAHTVTVASGNTAVPGWVTGGTVTPGPSSLIAEWEPPTGGGSTVYAYQVRHRDFSDEWRTNAEGWTEGPVILPRPTLRICGNVDCENPRSYEVTGLIGGNRYDVAVRARNANGWGEWHFIGIRNVANGFTPVIESAAVNGASLTLTFDRTIDTDSTPAADAFTVTVAGTDQTPTAVAISGSTVTLTLGTAATSGQTVTVSYARPGENPLQHNDAPALSFTNQSVTNNTS